MIVATGTKASVDDLPADANQPFVHEPTGTLQ
jgi:hypothetical protein